MSHYLEAAATLDRQRAADLKTTDAQLSESAQLYLAALRRENLALGACSRCHQIVRTEGHAEGCPWATTETLQ